jgi:hypothetical protein
VNYVVRQIDLKHITLLNGQITHKEGLILRTECVYVMIVIQSSIKMILHTT